MIPFLKLATAASLLPLIATRAGEVKLGERIQLPTGDELQEILQNSTSKFVLFGIPEDIGVRANGGVGGAHTAWEPALRAFLNIQSTTVLLGDEVLLLGEFDFDEWMRTSEKVNLSTLRDLVAKVDDAIYPLVEAIVASGKIPLAIGGGHNNSYPLLKGSALAKGRAVNCINLDAHSDYRMLEGRHSGNGFRYAKSDGHLDKYAIVGLHRNYNSQSVLDDMDVSQDLDYSFFEDIFLKDQPGFEQATQNAINFTSGRPTGIELDIDCIAHALSSAATPSGITPLQARKYLHLCAAGANVAYLHLTEGATTLRDGRTDPSTGKLIAYLLSDFLRAIKS